MAAEITPAEFKSRWDSGDHPFLVDVREPNEWAICNLAAYGAKLIPLAEVPARLAEIPKDKPVVVHCRSGGRSAKAQECLLAHGYTQITNLAGGTLRWSADVDPSMPRY